LNSGLKGQMKICLVSAFPPSRGGLSEYGFHIAQELQQNPLLSLSVLADTVPGIKLDEKDGEKATILRCWSFNDARTPANLLRVIRKIDPDVVWFNLLFTTFGHNPLIAFSGLTLPLLTRMSGYYTHVTLHHLMDTLDLEGAGVRFPRIYRTVGTVATKMLLWSNSVSVLMPAYRNILKEKYDVDNVHFRTHGILSRSPEYPDFSRRGNPLHRILAFGKWGTYKRLEPLITAFETVAAQMPNAKLVLAGGDHPRTPGYVASMARQYESSRIEFTGYVPEERIPDLFRSASVVVMPYSSSTGASGVAHLACAYGVPIMSADIPDFRHMAEEEGMALDFYRAGDIPDMAQHLMDLLKAPDRQRSMAKQNFQAALRMTMPKVINDYLRHFGLAQRARDLRPIHRYRKLPAWFSRSFVGRLVLRGSLSKVHRPKFPHVWTDGAKGAGLSDLHGRGHGAAQVPGDGIDGNSLGLNGLDGRVGHSSAARTEQSHNPNHGNGHHEASNVLPLHLADYYQTAHAKTDQRRVEQPAAMIPLTLGDSGGNGQSGNGKNGSGGLGAGDNHAGREGTSHVSGEIRTRKCDLEP
jgi:glycosyltransferase involved in cell wall biosynthesis